MHIPKKEFQVLDSLYNLRTSLKHWYVLIVAIQFTVSLLIKYTITIFLLHVFYQRAEHAMDIAEANKVLQVYEDVSDWRIEQYDIPQQTDEWVHGPAELLFFFLCRAMINSPVFLYQ